MRIIGGMFALEVPLGRPSATPFDLDAALRFVNARSAFRFILDERRPRRVWLPQYTCDALASAAADYDLRYYPVTHALEPETGPWLENVDRRDVVVAIDYFGFRRWTDALQPLADRGVSIVEDASQALFMPASSRASCIFYSPRKFAGVPDGGILIGATGVPALEPPPSSWWSKALASSLLRRRFDDGASDERSWFTLFQEAELEMPVGAFRASDVTEAILRTGIDYASMAERRIANYRTLAGALAEFAMYASLDDHTVPLGFPVRVQARDHVQRAMFAADIYPAVHWQNAITAASPASEHLSRELLTLPCDQRYDRRDMQRIIDAFRSAISR